MVFSRSTAFTTISSVLGGALVLALLACGTESPAAETAAARTDSAAAQADPESPKPGGKHTGFALVDDYVLEVEGRPSRGAALYSSSQTRALLIISQDLPAPVLLWPGSRRVETLQMLKVSRMPGGFAEVLPDPVIAVHEPFRVEPPDVRFSVEGVDAVLAPKPPLVGLRSFEEMIEHSSAYAERAQSYTPSSEALDSLRGSERTVRVRVFFGSWCPACGQMLPRLMRVTQELGEASPIEVEYYGLPRGFAGEPEAEKYGITSVPSAVVFEGGAEIGRINGNEWRSPEQTLSKLIGSS